MNKRIVLVGCGNIGRRHLQALVALPRPLDIMIVEPNRNEWSKAERAYADISNSIHALTFQESLSSPVIDAHLAIIATGADVRRHLFDELEARHDVSAYLFEKVLFQTVRDLVEVGDRLARSGKKAWVNCGRRGFPGYQDLRVKLHGRSVIDMHVTGGAWGLCSNVIHFLDLYTFVTGHEIVSGVGDFLNPGHIPSKRPGFIELTGHLLFRAGTGGIVDISCHNAGAVPITVEFCAPDERVIVDETGRDSLRLLPGGKREIVPFKSHLVSEMSFLYQDILETGQCVLPDYALSARQHQLFLDIVRGHLKLDEDDKCPIS